MPLTPEQIPTDDDVSKFRDSTLAQIEKDGLLESLDPIDITKFKTDDIYVKRFLRHERNNHEKSQKMAIGALKWRKEVGANYITEDKIDMNIVNKGVIFAHNRNKDGCKMLNFCVQKHNKSESSEMMRNIMIYWIERLEREERNKKISMVFDMRDAGIRHMDMDYIQYTINLFKFYYPDILNSIIVLEMPWLLNAMWKIIKSWLPPESLEIIKFVDRKQLLNYVTIDQCFVEWGGTDDYKFEFVPEVITPAALPSGVEEIDSKKVHFASDSSSSSASSVKINGSIGQTESGNLSVEVIPYEELVFPTNRIGSIATITVRNCGSSSIAFKIKTTSPDKYRVKPSVGTLDENEKAEVIVTLCEALSPSVLVRDKFLVLVVATSDAGTTPDGQLFKNAAREDLFEAKLRLGIENPDLTSINAVTNHVPSTQNMVIPAALTDKLNEIALKQADLQREVNSSRRLMLLTLLTMLAILVYVIVSTNNTTSMLLQKSLNIHSHKAEEL